MSKRHKLPIAAIVAICFTIGGSASAGDSIFFDFDFPDGTTDVGQGSALVDTGNFGPSVQGGRLQLTANTNSNNSAFHIPALSDSTNGLEIWFDYEMSDDAGGAPPADGFAFSFGAIPWGGTSAQPEEGWPGVANVISWEMDTWNEGDTEVGPAIGVNRPNPVPGNSLHSSSIAFTNGPIFTNGQTVSGSVHIVLDAFGTTDFTSTGAITNANFIGVDTFLSGFEADNSYTFAIAARTGGANEDLFIDNLRIQSVPEPSTIALLGLGVPVFLLLRRKRR